MSVQTVFGDEVTTVEWAVVAVEAYGPDLVLAPFAEDRERVERMLDGLKARSERPEDVFLVARTVVVSAWERVPR